MTAFPPLHCAPLLRTRQLIAWDLACALALLGWGWLLLRLLRINARSFASAGVTGVSFLLASAGWLNLLHLLIPHAAYLFVALGILALLSNLPRLLKRAPSPPSSRTRWFEWIPLAIGCFLVGYLITAGSISRIWNADDTDGYIPLAIKTVQTGALQPDPYSERRITTSLGGGSILDAFMAAPGDPRAMHFIDAGFGLLLFASAVWTLGRRWGAPPFAMGLLLCLLPFVPMLQVNLTIIYLSAATFLVIALILSDEAPSLGADLLVGLLAAAVCCTKSTNIPYAVLLLGLLLSLRWWFNRSAPLIRPLLVIGLIAILLLAPLGFAQHATEGTYLYPLLGRGFHQSAYGILPSPAQLGTLALVFIVAAPATLLLLLAAFFAWRGTVRWPASRRGVAIGLFLATALTVPIIAFSTGGEAIDRYSAPFVVPSALIFCSIAGLFWQPSVRASRFARIGGPLIALLFMLYLVGFIGIEENWNHSLYLAEVAPFGKDIGRRPWDMYVPKGTFEFYRQRDAVIQATIPPGATAIEVLSVPAGLDYRRNNIYINDFPGMAGPSIAPIGQGSAALRDFLRRNGVQYVLFSPHRYGVYPSEWLAFKSHPRDIPDARFLLLHPVLAHNWFTWSRMQNAVASDFRLGFYQLSQTQPAVYADQEFTVFSLN